MDWRRTRKITLTLNPANWPDGEQAYIWYKMHKPIGHFIENLGRAGVKVTDWTCNIEWHDNGFPHWHLLIEVKETGSKGMIGQELLHELWSWGDLGHRIHEGYFKSEKQFKEYTGYFAKSGYLHKDKQHQIILPSWASGQGWEGIKINRFSSKKAVKDQDEAAESQTSESEPEKEPDSEPAGPEKEPDSEPAGPEKEPEKRFTQKVTYVTKHSRCGQQVDIWEVEVCGDPDDPTIGRSLVGTFQVPYDLVVSSLAGDFYQGVGFSFEGTTGFVCDVLRAWEKAPPGPSERRKEFQPALPAWELSKERQSRRIARVMNEFF